MNSSLFFRLPRFAQSGVVSAASVLQRLQRYGGRYFEHLEFLSQSQYWTPETIRDYQQASLTTLACSAQRNVPFYATTFRRAGIRPEEITLDNLSHHIPILQKRDVQLNAKDLIACNYSRFGIIWLHTSGTTGTPLALPTTIDALRWNYAFFGRFLRWHGTSEASSRAVFGGRVLLPPSQSKPPFWQTDYLGRRKLFSTYHISPTTICHYVAELNKTRPALIEGYPSALSALARFASDQDLALAFSPTLVITSAESLQPWQRKDIEQFFNCKVRDQYGCAEQALNAAQCQFGTYHLSSECGIVEVVDDSGAPCSPGETGNVVVTGFKNLIFPLIRYAIGDTVAISTDPCKCGRTLPVIQEIGGRSDDYLITPDGRHIGRLAHVAAEIPGLHETQFVQLAPGRIEVLMVCDDFANAEAILLQRLFDRLPPDITVRVAQVDSISRRPNGKSQFVVRAFDRNE